MSLPFAEGSPDVLPASLREALRAQVDGKLALPALPETAARVLAACQDESSDLEELAELVVHDQTLAANVLRVANSVAYAPREPILSLRKALGRLGLSTVCDVAIAVVLKQHVFSVPRYRTRIRDLWRHSAASACYAQEIAQLLHRNVDSAFLCGLLHDVGMPIVMQLVCELERKGVIGDVTPEALEAAMHEFHGELGAKLAQSWRLGPWISAAILHHHDPAGAKLLHDDVMVVTAADLLAEWALDEAQVESDFGADGRTEDLGIPLDSLDVLLGKRARVREVAEAFL